MAEVRQQVRPVANPVVPPKEFTPFAYEGGGTIEPFDPQKVVAALARQQQVRATASTIRPDLERRREALETHMVRVGNYVGQNFGLVTRISEAEVQIKEVVQDAAGEWVERPAKLELQEAARTGGKR
ncbi:MAG: pilus assembly protein PilP [Burkholderiaceae bacterium]|nr:pilus assembly protein PilP [Burkholderiaceae bacterium]